jgi:hypothetical protein
MGWRSIVLVAVLIETGCGSSKPKPGASCLVNTDCTNPLACTFGRCHEACRESRDCPAGARCVTGLNNTNVCQLAEEASCLYSSSCPTPLFCAVDRQCHNQCLSAVRDCLVKNQTCVQGACVDPNDLDPATGLLKPAPDGGVPFDAAAEGADTGAAADVPADRSEPDRSADAPPQTERPKTGAVCTINGDCPNPLSCTFGRCHESCVASRDCPTGSRCLRTPNGGVCQLPDQKGCLSSACPAPLACAPDGQCRNQCQSGVDCFATQTCVENACAEPEEVDSTTGKLKRMSSIQPGTMPGRIYYSRGFRTGSAVMDGEIWVLKGDGSDTMITQGERPALSPDGQFIAFERSGPNGSSMLGRGDVWVRELASGMETKVFTNNDAVGCAVFAGPRVLFDYVCGLNIANRDGTGLAMFPSWGDCYTDCPAVSPDGSRVAVHSDHSGIGVESFDGTNQKWVVPAVGGPYHWPQWSADSMWLSYLDDGSGIPGGRNVHKIRADGSGKVQLSFGPPGVPGAMTGAAAWTSDGNWVLVAGNPEGTNSIYAVKTDGSGAMLRLPVSAGPPVEYVGAYAP